ncbi:MAG: HAD family hydrolase [Fimbriimonadaceae bacterium]
MTPKAVTFDVAGTLVDARWDPCRVVEAAAARIGLVLEPGIGDAYGALYAERLAVFRAANQRSDGDVRDFWIELDAEWLTHIGQDPRFAADLYDAGWEVLFGPEAEVFVPFPDADPALTRLRAAGLRMAAVSNWDNSLPAVIQMLGWTELFDLVVPSLVFGHEKPDRRIFDHATICLGLSAGEVLHVGDDPIDDLQGAREAGLRAVLIDRRQPTSIEPVICSLYDIEEAFEWTV